MEPEAARRLHGEAGNWLSRGRGFVIEALLARHRSAVGPVLEVGAGAGPHLALLTARGPIDVVETDPEAGMRLEGRREVRTLYATGIPELILDRRYGVIVAFDVIEHIADDGAALAWIAAHLVDDGLFVATVPAYPWMFSDHDRANRHYRRYTKARLARAMPNDLTVLEMGYFNTVLFPLAAISRLAWTVMHRVAPSSRDKQPSKVPPLLDGLFSGILRAEAAAIGAGAKLPFGLSLYCVARRRGPAVQES